MKDRLFYYFRRIAQAPLSVTLWKIGEILKKRLFCLVYSLLPAGKLSKSERDNCDRFLLELGTDLIKEINLIHNTTPAENGNERAEIVLSGKIECLGYGHISLNSPIHWHTDEIHNHQWPLDYFDSLDFVAQGKKCDVKVPWEKSRLQFLLWLAEGYVVDPDNRHKYLARFVEIVEDWSQSNPTGFGVNWIVSMEVAIRATNLLLASAVFWADLPLPTKTLVSCQLREHEKFITRFPELSDVPGNHYLANLMGLAVLHSCFFDLPVKKKAFREFYQEAQRQFELGGGHFERAPIYHRLCLDMLLLVVAFESRTTAVTGIASKILDQAIDFCAVTSGKNGRLPVLGDCDSGHILWFGGDARAWQWAAAFNGSQNGHKKLSDGGRRQLAWHRAISRQDSLSSSTITSHTEMPTSSEVSGFLVVNHANVHSVMRVGEQGLKGRASHDHDDALSIWVKFLGQDVVVEQGCHSYSLNENTRSNSIISLAHNLLQPEGTARFRPRQGSIVKTMVGAPIAHTNTIVGDGYSASINNKSNSQHIFEKHTRVVRVSDENFPTLNVTDTWETEDPERMELRWHFHPNFALTHDRGSRKLSFGNSDGSVIGRICFMTTHKIEISLFEFSYSETYGKKETSNGISVKFESANAGEICTQFAFITRSEKK